MSAFWLPAILVSLHSRVKRPKATNFVGFFEEEMQTLLWKNMPSLAVGGGGGGWCGTGKNIGMSRDH